MTSARHSSIRDANLRWGLAAARYGLILTDNDNDTITVEDPLFPGKQFVISRIALHHAYVPDALFNEVSRKILDDQGLRDSPDS